jgi:hypothetical protein
MIEKLTDQEKVQYVTTAKFFTGWLGLHPHPEEDDDFHRTIRMSALTYLSLYENFLELYKHMAQKDYIIPKNNKKLH